MTSDPYEATFAIAESALDLAKEFGHKDRINSHLGLSDEDFFVRVALYVKSIHTFQSILTLLQAQLADSAEILSRSLTEASMAQEFLCRHSIRLWEMQNKQKVPLNLYRKKLTRHFRTSLYVTHCHLDSRRWLEAAGPLWGRKDWNRTKKIIDAELIECEQEIGSRWMRRLENTRTYTGLRSIRHLACCLGAKNRRWYDAVYRMQSQAVHAADPRSYVAWTDDGHLTGPEQGEHEKESIVLNLSTLVFFEILRRFAKTFEVTNEQANRFWDLYLQLAEADVD